MRPTLGLERLFAIAILLFALFLVLLAVPALVDLPASFAVADASYRAGALVFAVDTLCRRCFKDLVEPGLVAPDAFPAGYGLAQAPLDRSSPLPPSPNCIHRARRLGRRRDRPHRDLRSGCSRSCSPRCRSGTGPNWQPARAALAGVNAAVVGLLAAVLYDPVATSAITGPIDVALALAAFVMLVTWKLPPWLIVIGFGFGAALTL